MKLNLHILYDEMQTLSRRIFTDEDISLDIQGVRFLPEDENLLSHQYLYLANADNLRRYKGIKPGINILCIGIIEEAFLQAHGWHAIVLEDQVDERKLFERIQKIFEEYESWDEELTEAILQKEPLQAVLDTGARHLWNPIALHDMAFNFIVKAGPPLPENITGTVWEVILEKGYPPMEALSHEERAIVFENFKRKRIPFFTRPPKIYTDKNFVSVSLFHGDHLFGLFASTDIIKPFTLGQVSLLDHLKNRIELYLINYPGFANINENVTYFADRVLQGFSIDPKIVAYQLSRRGWKLQGGYRIYFFSTSMSDLKDPLHGKQIVYRIEKILGCAMVFPYENGIIAIVEGSSVSMDKTLQSTLGKFLKDVDIRVGISMVFPNFMDLKYAYIQTKAALKEGRSWMPNEYLFNFQEYYSDHVINSLDEVTSLKSLCDPRLLQLALTGGENERKALHSLRLYLFNGRNISTTAALLKIHRNTLMYRLQNIEQLLELRLKDLNEQEFFNLYLTCLVTDYLNMGKIENDFSKSQIEVSESTEERNPY